MTEGWVREACVINKDECRCVSTPHISIFHEYGETKDGRFFQVAAALSFEMASGAEDRLMIEAERIAGSMAKGGRGSWRVRGGGGGDTALFGYFKPIAPAVTATYLVTPSADIRRFMIGSLELYSPPPSSHIHLFTPNHPITTTAHLSYTCTAAFCPLTNLAAYSLSFCLSNPNLLCFAHLSLTEPVLPLFHQ